MAFRRAVQSNRGPLDFLVIVTFGRTGSTTLQAVLNAHPHTIIRGENYGALRGIELYVRSIAEAADRHHAGSPSHPWYGTARLDPRLALRTQSDHVIDVLLRPKPDTQWLGFKEVRFEVGHFRDPDSLTSHLMFLQQLLPGARFVCNTRDPVDAAESGWWPDHPDAIQALRESVLNIGIAAANLRAILGPGRVVELDYAQWRGNPDFLTNELHSIGFPADLSIVTAALGEQLTHGPRRASVEGTTSESIEGDEG